MLASMLMMIINPYIADFVNHRVVKWKYDAKSGEVVAGGNG